MFKPELDLEQGEKPGVQSLHQAVFDWFFKFFKYNFGFKLWNLIGNVHLCWVT